MSMQLELASAEAKGKMTQNWNQRNATTSGPKMFPRATAAMVSHKEKLEPDPSNQFRSAYASKGHRDHGSSGETSVEDSVLR